MICMSCGNPIGGTVMEDGYMCHECGRTRLCEYCAMIGNHDCEPLPFWVADGEPPADSGEGEGLRNG